MPPTAEEAIATLVNIASIDRPEDNLPGLPRLLAKARGRDIEDVYRGSDAGVLADVRLAEEIKEGVRAAVRASVERSTDINGRVTEVNPMMANLGALFQGGSPMKVALEASGFPDVTDDELAPLFEYCEFCLKQVVADNEMGALLEGLDGEFILPGPGGDPIRNPLVLPTGKNMHALDPQAPHDRRVRLREDRRRPAARPPDEGQRQSAPWASGVSFVCEGDEMLETRTEPRESCVCESAAERLHAAVCGLC